MARSFFILASPTTHVDARTPPTLHIHGGHDQLVRQENLTFLDHLLAEADVPHETLVLGYAQHGFDYNSNGWGSQITESVLLDFLAKYTAAKN